MPLASTCLPAIHSYSSFNMLLFLLTALTSVLSLCQYLNQQIHLSSKYWTFPHYSFFKLSFPLFLLKKTTRRPRPSSLHCLLASLLFITLMFSRILFSYCFFPLYLELRPLLNTRDKSFSNLI